MLAGLANCVARRKQSENLSQFIDGDRGELAGAALSDYFSRKTELIACNEFSA